MHYELFTKIFKSQTAVKKHLQSIKNSYPDFVPLAWHHFLDIFFYLGYRDDYVEKIGAGISKIWVAKNGYGRCFYVKRKDGSIDDFSLHVFRKRTSDSVFRAACRSAIKPFIQKFRRTFFAESPTSICPELNITMDYESSHVDHQYPDTFSAIANDFINTYNIDVENVHTHSTGHAIVFDDPELEKNWIKYHNSRATLRVISAEANQRLNDKETIN